MKNVLEQGSNVLWVDFLANGIRLSEPNEMKKLVAHASKSGVTHLVIDAKIPYGYVTYPSQFAKHVSHWSDGKFQVWNGRDFLQEMLVEARAAGLKVIANVDVFGEGLGETREGKVFEKPDWQVMMYNPELSSISSAAENTGDSTVFVNPIHPEVVAYELAIIQEVAEQYSVDGIVLDRCRYPNIFGDFSDRSRQQFEQYIGHPIVNWPQDIFTLKSGTKEIEFGSLFGKWTEWRALNIKKFVIQAKQVVNKVNPDLLFCIYVGSWYPLYYNEGVNWASETYRTDLPWASDTYHVSAYADELDFLMTGCYYPEVRIEEAERNGRPASWYSVEGAIDVSLQAVNGQIPVVASLYLKDYDGDVEQFKKAVRMCKEKTYGVMLFDAVYLEDYNWWEELASVL